MAEKRKARRNAYKIRKPIAPPTKVMIPRKGKGAYSRKRRRAVERENP